MLQEEKQKNKKKQFGLILKMNKNHSSLAPFCGKLANSPRYVKPDVV